MKASTSRSSKFKTLTAASALISVSLALTACTPPATPPPIDLAANLAAAKVADANWSKTAGTHDADAMVAFYTEDAVLLPPGAPAVTDKAGIRAFWKEFFMFVDTISWQADRFEIASSGDIAWEYGHWTTTAKGPKGATVTDHGKLVEVWKKQSDGSWKCSIDMAADNGTTPAPSAKMPMPAK
jgi:ketosteroid isomerase-like protein